LENSFTLFVVKGDVNKKVLMPSLMVPGRLHGRRADGNILLERVQNWVRFSNRRFWTTLVLSRKSFSMSNLREVCEGQHIGFVWQKMPFDGHSDPTVEVGGTPALPGGFVAP
jgi:hypothetical protein